MYSRHFIFSIAPLALAVAVHAGEPKVVEQQTSDGLMELRVVSEAGKTLATYRADLKHHHEPATSDSGLIRQWEQYRFGGFFCFNDNQFDGRELSQNKDATLYYPTDVLNGEVTLPPAGGHQPFRTVKGKRYYLPFEFELVSQRRPEGTTTPWGPAGAWFTYGEGKGLAASQPVPARQLFDWVKQAYDRGSAIVLLSLASDHTGSMRPDDVRQLEELGKLLREAGLLEVPKAAVQPAKKEGKL